MSEFGVVFGVKGKACFVCAQYWVPSKDGTVQIPLLVTRKKDTPLDGLAPTILHGYGGAFPRA